MSDEPLLERCDACQHPMRLHGPLGGCYMPLAWNGPACGCEALRTPFEAVSGELTYTPTTQENE